MKRLLFLFMVTLLLAACGDDAQEPEKKKTENEEVATQPEAEEEKVDIEPKLSESKVSFTNFTFEIKDVKLKDNKLMLDTLYTNDSFDGEKAFMAAAGLDVEQGGELIEEVSGVTEDPNSNFFYKNDVGIWAPIEFEYELANDVDDVEITIVPRDWDEESKTITVSLQ